MLDYTQPMRICRDCEYGRKRSDQDVHYNGDAAFCVECIYELSGEQFKQRLMKPFDTCEKFSPKLVEDKAPESYVAFLKRNGRWAGYE